MFDQFGKACFFPKIFLQTAFHKIIKRELYVEKSI